MTSQLSPHTYVLTLICIDVNDAIWFEIFTTLSGFSDKQNLKVREHKLLGPYVDGLSKLVVSSFMVSCYETNFC